MLLVNNAALSREDVRDRCHTEDIQQPYGGHVRTHTHLSVCCVEEAVLGSPAYGETHTVDTMQPRTQKA